MFLCTFCLNAALFLCAAPISNILKKELKTNFFPSFLFFLNFFFFTFISHMEKSLNDYDKNLEELERQREKLEEVMKMMGQEWSER